MADEEVQETQEATQDVSRETTVDEYSVPDRPEWLPEKFKTEKDLVESYQNLEKKIGQKEEDLKRSWEEELNKVAFENRPEKKGDYILPENIDQTMSADNPLLKWWVDHSFDNGFSQDEFAEGIKMYTEGLQANLPNEDQEIARLVDNSNERIQAVELFANKFFPEDMLPSVEKITETADGVFILEHIMEKLKTNQPIQTEPANRITQEGLESMQADPRYWDPVKRDPAFVEKVREGYTKLYNGG